MRFGVPVAHLRAPTSALATVAPRALLVDRAKVKNSVALR